jgi:hypothetical protein
MRTSESIHLRPHDELLREIDKFRRRKANPPSRPKAVEELVQEGLAHQDDLLVAAAPSEITELKARNACVPEKGIAAA